MPYIGIPNPQVGDPTYLQWALDVNSNLEFLNGQLGGSSGDALANNSFEIDSNLDGTPDNWSVTSYTVGGGNFGVSNAQSAHASKSFFFSCSGGANGGGEVIHDAYTSIQNLRPFYLRWAMYSSAATLANRVRVKWYDKNFVPVVGTPESEVYFNNTTNANRWIYFSRFVVPPETARYFRPVFIGIEAGSGAGTVYFDHVTYKFLDQSNAHLLVAAPDSPPSMLARADMIIGPNTDANGLNPGTVDGASPVINEAIALCAAAGGGRVYLAEGTYPVGQTDVAGAGDSEITLASGVELHGFGRKTRITWNAGASYQYQQAPEQMIIADTVTQTGVFNLFVDGTSEPIDPGVGGETGYYWRTGVYFKNVTDARIEGVEGAGFKGNNGIAPSIPLVDSAAIYLESCTRVHVKKCESRVNFGFGVTLKTCTNCEVIESVIRANRMAGVALDGGFGNIVRHNLIQDNCQNNEGQAQGGVYVYGTSRAFVIVGNVISGNGWLGLRVADGDEGIINANAIYSNGATYGGGGNQAGIELSAAAHRCSVTGNKLLANVTVGIYIFGTGHNVSENHVNGSNLAGVATAAYGIYVVAGATSSFVRGNFVFGNVTSNYVINEQTSMRKDAPTVGGMVADATLRSETAAAVTQQSVLVSPLSGSRRWIIFAAAEADAAASNNTGYAYIGFGAAFGTASFDNFYVSGQGMRVFSTFYVHTGTPFNVYLAARATNGAVRTQQFKAMWIPAEAPFANDPFN